MSTVLTLNCPAFYTPGVPLTCTVTKSGDTPAALQFTFNPDPDAGAWTAAVGAAAAAAGKSLQSAPLSRVCIVFGLNQTAIPDGEVAEISVLIPVGANTPTLTFSISAPAAANAEGQSIDATVSEPVSVPRASGIYFATSYFPWVGADPMRDVFGAPGLAAGRVSSVVRTSRKEATQ